MYYVLADPPLLVHLLKLTWISQPFGIMASAFGKCSVAFLISRIMGPNSFYRRWFLNVNTILYMSASVVASIIVFCQCKPAEGLWKKTPDVVCWDPKIVQNFDLFQSGKTPRVIFTSDVANYLSHSLRRGVGLLLGHSTNLDYLESAVVCLEAHCDLHSVGIRWLVSSERTSGKASN